MNAWFPVFIAALLLVSALITVAQTRPYHALVSRGIMGVLAVLLYAVLGAPDVALTEALVGTLLTIVLFAVATRTSLAVRIGVLDGSPRPPRESPIRAFCEQWRLYERWVSFEDERELVAALKAGRVDVVRVNPADAPMLERYLPEATPLNEPITLLAEHARWHEREMKKRFGDSSGIARLKYRNAEGSH